MSLTILRDKPYNKRADAEHHKRVKLCKTLSAQHKQVVSLYERITPSLILVKKSLHRLRPYIHKSHISDLPTELIDHVFGFITNPVHKRIFARVCRLFCVVRFKRVIFVNVPGDKTGIPLDFIEYAAGSQVTITLSEHVVVRGAPLLEWIDTICQRAEHIVDNISITLVSPWQAPNKLEHHAIHARHASGVCVESLLGYTLWNLADRDCPGTFRYPHLRQMFAVAKIRKTSCRFGHTAHKFMKDCPKYLIVNRSAMYEILLRHEHLNTTFILTDGSFLGIEPDIYQIFVAKACEDDLISFHERISGYASHVRDRVRIATINNVSAYDVLRLFPDLYFASVEMPTQNFIKQVPINAEMVSMLSELKNFVSQDNVPIVDEKIQLVRNAARAHNEVISSPTS